ncbi:MAG: hypothetical protein AAGE52_02270 [Myxococcota bacterium]
MTRSAQPRGLFLAALSAFMLWSSGAANAHQPEGHGSGEGDSGEGDSGEGLGVDGPASSAEDSDRSVGFYLAAGLSISNTGDGNFGEATYPSIEFGLSKGAASFGLVFGRESNDYSGSGEASDYWWELKLSVAVPVRDFSAYGLLGFGNYLSTDQFFIEYGLGVSYSWGPVSVFAQISNWDGVWYVTPGLMLSF